MKQICAYLFLIVITGNSFADDSVLSIDIDENHRVCDYVKGKLEENQKLLNTGTEKIFGHWHAGQHGKPNQAVEFDIDNDGAKEVLQRKSTSFRSHENDSIQVYKRKSSGLVNVGYVGSNPGKWEYLDLGLAYLLIGPLTFDDVNYLVLTDELFGREGSLDKSIVVAKYGHRKVHPEYKKSPNKLNVVCLFRPKRVFLP